MADAGDVIDRAAPPWWFAVLFVGVAGAVASITVLFRGMRAIMATGASSCASGGAYVVANPCPKGVGAMVPLSIWIGIGFLVLAAVATAKLRLPSIAWLAWPALFLSLGWNFWEFGLDPPGADGVAWGWIVCGVLFVLMGATPLVLAVAHPGDISDPTRARQAAALAARLGASARVATTPPPFQRAPISTEPPVQRTSAMPTDDPGYADDADDLVGSLERLASLHRSGALSDAEYQRAKDRLLGHTGGDR